LSIITQTREKKSKTNTLCTPGFSHRPCRLRSLPPRATSTPVARPKSEFKVSRLQRHMAQCTTGVFFRWNNIENNTNTTRDITKNKTKKCQHGALDNGDAMRHAASVTGWATHSLPARENRERLKRFASLQRHLTHDTLFLLSLRCLSPTLTPLLAWFFLCVRTGRHFCHRYKTGKSPYETP